MKLSTGSLLILALKFSVAIATAQVDPYYSKPLPCPAICNPSGGPETWAVYQDLTRLSLCTKPVLLDFSLYAPIQPYDTSIAIRACTAGNTSTSGGSVTSAGYKKQDRIRGRDLSLCGFNSTLSSHANATAQLSWWGSENASPNNDVQLAATTLQQYVSNSSSCEDKIILAYVRGSIVGLYSGAQIDTRESAANLLKLLIDNVEAKGVHTRKAISVCGPGRDSLNVLGVVADVSGDLYAVQSILRAWSEGKCISGADGTQAWNGTAIWSFKDPEVLQTRQLGRLYSRATCRTTEVASGDTCTSLASRCGFGSTLPFEQFNQQRSNLCETLQPGELVCCSSGELPDITPKPNEDGTCASYTIQANDGCQVIAVKHGLTIDLLDSFNNKQTWGWYGCSSAYPGIPGTRICVSEGRPPMPAPVSNAECGPTVPGTEAAADGTNLADLNPCPLNLCCNVWGQCGNTVDYCVISNSESGNPGTSPPGVGGCISNCGMDIVNNDEAPAEFKKVGYFEGWNFDRPCQHMNILDIDNSYTHVHFSFGEISDDFQVVITDDVKDQWDAFISAGSSFTPKKVLAFGGWAFSTDADSARRFAQAMSPNNRELFASRVVQFAVDNGLDGLDFDWEYPGATDIPGSIPGEADDGLNYLKFLARVRAKLPTEKTLSIAAASSYWYLRGFPIKEISKVVDYIVFMTYDLHGQWDADNQWANSGCPAGNCLRSHVNWTETYSTLAMITKAGVPSNKAVVGVASYGRSFKMADAACSGPDCLFLGTGADSPAKAGRCTGQAGYISNYEIEKIIKGGGDIQTWYDEPTDSDYLVYEGTEWVAYMSEKVKSSRMSKYKALNFAGTSDWAIDLQGEGGDDSSSNANPVYIGTEIYQTPTAHCEKPCVLVLPPSTLATPTTISPPAYTTSLQAGTTVTTITVQPEPVTMTEILFSNVNVTQGVTDGGAFYLCTSIPLAPINVPLTFIVNGHTSSSTRGITLPPWPQITAGPPSKWKSACDPWRGGSPVGENDADEATKGGGGGGGNDEATKGGSSPGGTVTPTTSVWQPPEGGPTTTVAGPLPTFTEFPPAIIEPIIEGQEDNEDEDDDEDYGIFILPCDGLWFFSFCIDFEEFKIKKWKIILPPGRIGPGPPPIEFVNVKIDDWKIQYPTFPPWPVITNLPTKAPLVFPAKPADCKPITEPVEFKTVSRSLSVSSGTTITVKESTLTRTGHVLGCEIPEYTPTTVELCGSPVKRTAAPVLATSTPSDGATDEATITPAPESQPEFESHTKIQARAPNPNLNQDDPANWAQDLTCLQNPRAYICYPNAHGPSDVNQIQQRFTAAINSNTPGSNFQYKEARSDELDFSAFFVVVDMPKAMMQAVSKMSQIRACYDYWQYHQTGAIVTFTDEGSPFTERGGSESLLLDEMKKKRSQLVPNANNATNSTGPHLDKRFGVVWKWDKLWHNSLISAPPATDWLNDPEFVDNSVNPVQYKYHYDNSVVRDQYIYIVETGEPMANHAEFQSVPGVLIKIDPYGAPPSQADVDRGNQHMTGVAALAAGVNLALVPSGSLIAVSVGSWDPPERVIHGLLAAANDIKKQNRQGASVINMSFGTSVNVLQNIPGYAETYLAVLKLLESLNVVLTIASGNNNGFSEAYYPHKFVKDGSITNAIVVGATDKNARRWGMSNYFSSNQPPLLYAPGHNVPVPNMQDPNGYIEMSGTSFAAPIIASLVAYFRGLPSGARAQFAIPAKLINFMSKMVRSLDLINDPSVGSTDPPAGGFVWNGQVLGDSCILGTAPPYKGTDLCSIVHQFMPGGSKDGTVTFENGSPSPTCTANCGKLCTGYYCQPKPTGTPPDFVDPEQNPIDPSKDGTVPGDPDKDGTVPSDPDKDGTVPGSGGDDDGGFVDPRPSTGSPDDLPDCLYAQVLVADIDSSIKNRSTVTPLFVYKNLFSACDAVWCSEYHPVTSACARATFSCAQGYSARFSYYSTGVGPNELLDFWRGIYFKAPDMAKEVYFEVPYIQDSIHADCTLEVDGQQIACSNAYYGGYFGNETTCADYRSFVEETKVGMARPLSKTAATKDHSDPLLNLIDM